MSSIAEAFDGRSIFITGASGFVGKDSEKFLMQMLVEKLLRSVPGLSTIFVLIRPMKGESGDHRWRQIEKSVLFNAIRRNCPERLRKVVVVDGDICDDNFGIAKLQLDRVLAETSVVFHCAATVRFNECLKNAVDLNVRAVKRMVDLCHRMPKLAAFLHCSTAYVNVDRRGGTIAERMYPCKIDARKLATAVHNLEDAQIEILCGDIIKNHYNTYCITKSLGEQIIAREAADLPVVIFRPSIIAPVWQDGIPGWSETYQGLTAILAAMYAGAMPRYPMIEVNPNVILDCVPVDVVTNMMIVSAADRIGKITDCIPVIHCCTGDLNPCDMKLLGKLGQAYAMRYPAEKILSPPFYSFEGYQSVEWFRHKWRSEFLGPAMDKLTMLFGRKPFWAKLFAKMRSVYMMLIPFAQYYHFETKEMARLIAAMSEEDKKEFNFDVRQINWHEYDCDLYMGLKMFLLKDNIEDEKLMRRARLNLLSHQLFSLLPLYALCYAASAVASRYLSGSLARWGFFLLLSLVATVNHLKDWFTYTNIKSLDEYRDKLNGLMRPQTSKDINANIASTD